MAKRTKKNTDSNQDTGMSDFNQNQSGQQGYTDDVGEGEKGGQDFTDSGDLGSDDLDQ